MENMAFKPVSMKTERMRDKKQDDVSAELRSQWRQVKRRLGVLTTGLVYAVSVLGNALGMSYWLPAPGGLP